MFNNNNPFGGYPPYAPFIVQNNPDDEIDRLEKTVKFLKSLKDEGKKDDDKKDDKKSSFTTIEWFMMLMAYSSVVQTILVLWLIRGR